MGCAMRGAAAASIGGSIRAGLSACSFTSTVWNPAAGTVAGVSATLAARSSRSKSRTEAAPTRVSSWRAGAKPNISA